MKNQTIKFNSRFSVLVTVLLFLGGASSSFAQLQTRWLRVTDLQGPYSNLGGEFEGQFPTSNGDFFSWPAAYGIEQNTIRSRALWIGCTGFDDPGDGKIHAYKVVGAGPRDAADRPNQIFPVDIKLSGRRVHPVVKVDDINATQNDTYDEIDEVNPTLEADRVITTKFNTSVGVSVTRKIMAFEPPYHSNYHINDYVFKNTGIYNGNGDTKSQTLHGVYFFFNFRECFAGEANTGYGQGWAGWAMTWGRSTVNHNVGDDKTETAFTDPSSPLYHMRAFYSWYAPLIGGPDGRTTVTYAEDWGCPNETDDGIMAAAKYGGIVTLHADVSTSDHSDDLNQPTTTWYAGSDRSEFQIAYANQYDDLGMSMRYALMSEGHPSAVEQNDVVVDDDCPQNHLIPGRIDGGGASQDIAYGPYEIAPGDSIHIVFAEGVDGISRAKNREVGGNWIQWRNATGTPTLRLPNNSTTTDFNLYKRTWMETGKDSIVQTYRCAINNYQANYQIPQPPPPPSSFLVTSGGDRIFLEWERDAESDPHFDGYVIYRSEGNVLTPKTYYTKIFECNASGAVGNYYDTTAVNGLRYYYYIQSKDDGTQNDIEPGKPLYSSMFWTVTSLPAKLNFIHAGDFRSHQSGDWKDTNSWERFDGSVWISPAPYTPADTDGVIKILGGDTITVSTADSVDQLSIQENGELVIDTSVSFKVINGDSTDLEVYGTLINYGTITTGEGMDLLVNGTLINHGVITAGERTDWLVYGTLKNDSLITLTDSTYLLVGSESIQFPRDSCLVENSGSIVQMDSVTIRFGPWSTYKHLQNGGVIPKAEWYGAVCEITGVTNTMPSNINQNFDSFVWDCPNQNANFNLNWQGKSVSSLTISNTNWNQESTSNPSFHLSLCGANGSCHISSLYVSNNAALTTHDGSFSDTVTVSGIMVTAGGIFLLADSGGASTYYCSGNITVPDSGYIGTSDSVSQSTIVFSGSGNQYYNINSKSVTDMSRLNYQVGSYTTLMIGSSVFAGLGYFTVDSGATMEIRQPGGIDGTIKVTGTKTLKNGSSYIFDGTTPQVTGNLLPDTIRSITIIDTAGVMLSHNVVANGLVELQRGTLSSGGNTLSYGINGGLRYSDITAQTTTDTEFPSSNGPSSLSINNPQGATLHASRTISGMLNLNSSGKLTIGGNILRANAVTNASSSSYVVMNGTGSLILNSVGTGFKLFPVGTSAAYAPVWIRNTGTVDTISVRVAEDSSIAQGGGRVKAKWTVNENTPGGGIYLIRFGWMASLEDSVFKTNRILYSKIFRLSDTTELGGGYSRQLTSEPYYVSRAGITSLDNTFIVGSFTSLTGIEETPVIPTEFSLGQNYPNPFNPSTTISFDLPKQSFVSMKVFDLLGREVAVIVSEELPAGNYKRQWNAQNLSSGIYFYRLQARQTSSGQAGTFTQTKKLLLLK